MMVLFYVNIFLVKRYLEKEEYLTFAIATVGLLTLLLVVRVVINTYIPVNLEMLRLKEETIGARSAVVFVTNLTMIGFSTFYQLLRNRFESEHLNQAIINEQNEAQLKFLRSQINPHFLFNTLNNIYSLAVVRSEKTADMVLKLSNLLRYVIYEGRVEQVELQKEYEQLQHYIGLFQMRSETPLDISLEAQGAIEDWTLEPMILIPIIENCFKHCDFETNPEAYIKIQLAVQDKQLCFKTQNTFDDQDLQKDKVGGVGLENIQRRLQLKYDGRHALKVNKNGNVFEVKLELRKL